MQLTVTNVTDAPHIESKMIEASVTVEGSPSAWITWYEPNASAGSYPEGAVITVTVTPGASGS